MSWLGYVAIAAVVLTIIFIPEDPRFYYRQPGDDEGGGR